MKNVRKRFLSALLALALVLALVPVTAAADGPVAQIGGTKYETLQAAIEAAGTGVGTNIILLQDVTLDASRVASGSGNAVLDITKSLTIDGQGLYAIRGIGTSFAANVRLIGVRGDGVNVTLKNVTLDGGNTDKIDWEDGARHGLNVWNAGTVRLENVRIENCKWYAVVNHGSELVVNGLTTSGNQWGINLDSEGTITIDNANISESDSIVYENVANGELTVNNGSYQNIVVQASEGNTCRGTIALKGGSFNDVFPKIADDTAAKPNAEAVVSVTGGTFNKNISLYVKNSTPLAQVNNGNYIVGESNIRAAVASAPYGSTVTVLKGNVNLSNVDVGTTVTNTGGGAVTVNGSSVQAGSSYTVERYYIPPVILTQPQSTTATEGGVATFSVSAINPNNPWNPNDLFIRWMISYDGGTVWREFAVGPTAELPVTLEENGMLVQCRVNSGVEVRLDPVTVTVLPGMDIVPGEEEIITPGEEEGDVQEGTEETPPEETVPEEGLEELPEEGDVPAEEEPVDVPKTGDSLPSIGLALMLGLAACAVVLKKARAK